MSDSPGAAAPAAASAEAEATLRARAAASLADSRSSSGAPAVGAALPSDDMATWARQVEAEFAGIYTCLDEKFAELSATIASSGVLAAAYADQVANFDIILRQFVENNSGPVAPREDGEAQERQRQKAQLATKMATWNKVNTARKLWIIRGRIPPNLGDSPADV